MTAALAAMFAITVGPANAAECKSVRGFLNGETVSATRTATMKSGSMRLSGHMAGKAMPVRTLPCVALAKGVYCEKRFESVLVTVMTNDKRMVETVTIPNTGEKIASVSYVCNGPIK